MDPPSLEYIVNHVFMPLRLPQGSDLPEGDFTKEYELVKLFHAAAMDYLTRIEPHGPVSVSKWSSVVKMLHRLVALNQPEPFLAEDMATCIGDLKDSDILAFLVRQQNAGVILRVDSKKVIAEAFRVSLPNADVMACHGKIVRNFPEACIRFSSKYLRNHDFAMQLASVVSQLNVDEMDESLSHSFKAGSEVRELRDPPSPHLIMDWLLNVLTVVDGDVAAPPSIITKHIADDVLWKNALLPWRRSQLWLVARVAVQSSIGMEEYKHFMLYFMTSILKQSCVSGVNDEILFIMRTKLGRRAAKLQEAHILKRSIYDIVASVQTQAQKTIISSCGALRGETSNTQFWQPSALNFDADTHLHLEHSMPQLSAALSRSQKYRSPTLHDPCNNPILGGKTTFSEILQVVRIQLSSWIKDDDTYFQLTAFEDQVGDNIDSWTSANLCSPDAVALLHDIISGYHTFASSIYQGNPEANSIMILTIIELWISLDKIAIAHLPLLQKYSSELSPKLLQPLLLRKSSHVNRAVRASHYLQSRQRLASIFAPASPTSFAVVFFSTSQTMQKLKHDVEIKATNTVKEKRNQATLNNARFQSLMADAQSTPHEHIVERHCERTKMCPSCKIRKRARRIKVPVYEWPLPSRDCEAQTFIFECLLPNNFSHWRAATYSVMRDMFMSPLTTPKSPRLYARLKSYAGQNAIPFTSIESPHTITLASTTKSFYQSHYKYVKCPASVDSVVVSHGSQWHLSCGTGRDELVCDDSTSFTLSDPSWLCQMTLPESSIYTGLEFTLPTTSHLFNQVLASQSHCSPNLSLHEFLVFGTLRAGGKLQWLNIATALSTRSLAFNRSPVYVLLAQAVQQLGVIDNGKLQYHHLLENPSYTERLLGCMEDFHETITQNWQEITSIKCLIEIALRVLTGSIGNNVHSRIVQFLRHCRHTLYAWLRKHLSQSEQCFEKNNQTRLKHIALLCHQTYDVDRQLITSVLSSPSDVAIYLHCLIVVHNISLGPTDPRQLDMVTHVRAQRLAYHIEGHLRSLIAKDPSGLEDLLQEFLPDFHPEDKTWVSLTVPNERWVVGRSKNNRRAPQIALNILDGQLLVDGIALGVLPDPILAHKTYQELFGLNNTQVLPSNLPGLDYRSQYLVHGFYLYFRLDSGNLIIQSLPHRGHTADLCQYLPRGTFEGDLPRPLLAEHCYWLQLSSKRIEFRPLSKPWIVSKHNWHIILHDRFSVMEKIFMKSRLINPDSNTFKMMYRQGEALEERNSVVVIYQLSPHSYPILIGIPRYHLSFTLDMAYGNLESRDFPGTVIDLDSNIGTLYGLKNKLVLRTKVSKAFSASSSRRRRVLIPHGSIHYQANKAHMSIIVAHDPDEDFLRYHVYHIDTDLRCLVSADNSLEARLYKIYLHGLTSQVIPDSLTGQTGLEEALSELYSAACMSFQRLKSEELSMLSKIRALTPCRTHYPLHLQIMQTIQWDNKLPAFIQTTHFERRVREILDYNEALSIFDPNEQKITSHSADPGSPQLFARSEIRESLTYPVNVVCRTSTCDSRNTIWVPTVLRNHTPSGYLAGAHMTWNISPRKLTKETASNTTLHSFFLDASNSISLPSSQSHDHLEAITYHSNWFSLSNTVLRDVWFNIFADCCSDATEDRKRFRLLFSFSAWLYGRWGTLAKSYVPQFLAIIRGGSRYSDFVSLVQQRQSLDFSGCSFPTIDQVSQIVESWWSWDDKNTIFSTSRAIIAQWDRYPLMPLRLPSEIGSHIGLQQELDNLFHSCLKSNQDFHHLMNDMEAILQKFPPFKSSKISLPKTLCQASAPLLESMPRKLTSPGDLCRLFQHVQSPAPFNHYIPHKAAEATIPIRGACHDSARDSLISILTTLSKSNVPLQKHYAKDIDDSLTNLDVSFGKLIPEIDAPTLAASDAYALIKIWSSRFEQLWTQICNALQPCKIVDRLRETCGQWPRIHLRNVLQMMTKPFWGIIPSRWQFVLVELCFRMLMMQYARRIYVLVKLDRTDELADVLRSGPPAIPLSMALTHPDWLLIQIESNFCARLVQLRVATEMYQPTSGCNLALQLNMGEGKTSVIVPFVASSLADGGKMVRVMVLKPLAQQMFHLLASRLCGLPNKRVAYLPFSRHMLHRSDHDIAALAALYQGCVDDGAVIIAQPEHVLSATLLSVEKILFSSTRNANRESSLEALQLYQKFRDTARDILDENDELLHPRYQLVYTIGDQHHVEGHPDRWITLQQVLSICIISLWDNSQNASIVLRSKAPWIFPQIHSNESFSSFSESLATVVIEHLVSNQLPNLNVVHLAKSNRNLISRFVCEHQPPSEAVDLVHSQGQVLRGNLLLLRGYITTGLLGYGLRERRWRVDYGLDHSRSMMAVPFRSKDVPSPRAEFGHPDLSILLTCLAYYYQGLTEEQLRRCFIRLLTLSAPSEQYSEWISVVPSSHLHPSIRDISGINLEDSDQFTTKILPLFSQNFMVVNFYLGDFVFPKSAKCFPHKLPTSGWDLAEDRPNITTGFSGTKDNHYLLPLSIKQDDPVNQAGTNALVLMYMLQSSNNRYIFMEHGSIGGKGIIDLVVRQRENTHVLLDVGAQVLDLSNQEVAKYWLDTGMERVEAAIFFDEHDELMVIRRDGTVESFQSSTYNQQTGKCVVYLDDAHTRGTDLKFPRTWRAAVTLGKKVTKDRLIQGCMRMRQLGAGQSLMFFAPPDVDFAIRKAANKPNLDQKIEIQDIVLWSMVETCNDVEHYAPAWAQQGADYLRRHEALDSFSAEDLRTNRLSSLRQTWLQKESKTLNEMYLPSTSQPSHEITDSRIRERLNLIGVDDHVHSRDLNEEQEREVAHEVEAEPETERPQEVRPADHNLHPDLDALVRRGTFISNSPAFCTVDEFFKQHFDGYRTPVNSNRFSNRLLITLDFMQTLESTSTFPCDFMKPVQWVLSWIRNRSSGTVPPPLLIVISQHEANALLPQIQQSKFVELHCYITRTASTIPRFQGLQFFSIPSRSDTSFNPTLLTQLDIFAGQLYPCSYEDYERVCEFLGVDVAGNLTAQSDGFVLPQHRQGRLVGCPFTTSPMGFFREFFSLRRKGQTFDKSPIGKLLEGRVLQQKDFA